MIIGVAMVLARPDGRVLFGLRQSAREDPCWCFPGGKLEVGESFESAARRETWEEAGIAVSGDLDATAVLLGSWFGVFTIVGIVEASVAAGVEAANGEPDRFQVWDWCDPGEPPLPLFASTRSILQWRAGRIPDGCVVYPIGAGR